MNVRTPNGAGAPGGGTWNVASGKVTSGMSVGSVNKVGSKELTTSLYSEKTYKAPMQIRIWGDKSIVNGVGDCSHFIANLPHCSRVAVPGTERKN